MNTTANSEATGRPTEGQPSSASASASAGTGQRGSTGNKPLLPVQLDPAIRSAPSGASVLSKAEISRLKALPYRVYLTTPWWISRRNQALRDAGYRCAVCSTKRQLQVHHQSYERLGCEAAEDLMVVCRGCHVGHHYNETQAGIGVYAKVLSEAIHDMPDAEFTDVVEEAKLRCARLKIPYHHEHFQAAVSRVNSRIAFRPPERSRELYVVTEPGKPLTKAEAAACLSQYGLGVWMTHMHMPEVKPISVRQMERTKALRIVLEALAEQAQRCDEAEKPLEP
jgi:hypothetical protein